LGVGPFDASVGSGNGLNIELQIAKERGACGRAADGLLAGNQRSSDFQATRERDALDGDTAGEQSGLRSSGESQRATNEPAHAFGIANANAVGENTDVVAKNALGIVHSARKVKSAASGLGGHFLEERARGIEDDVALDGA